MWYLYIILAVVLLIQIMIVHSAKKDIERIVCRTPSANVYRLMSTFNCNGKPGYTIVNQDNEPYRRAGRTFFFGTIENAEHFFDKEFKP